MQRIKHRLGVLLADALALIDVEVFDLALYVVDLGELLQCEACDLAFVRRMQVKEFAPRVRQANDFRDALRKARFVPSKVVADQRAPPLAQEVARM